MGKCFQVMLAEDNIELSKAIKSYFDIKKDIEINAIAHNALEAIELLRSDMPDLIVLDLVMPYADGFVLLEHLKENAYAKTPEVIVLSSLNHEAIIKRACDYGAIYYMAKPFSMEDLHDRILNILNRRMISANQQEPTRQTVPQQMENQEMESFFMDIGISPHTKGFLFLCKAIELTLQNPNLIFNLTKELYPSIGALCQTTAANVEHSIRHSIEVAWNSKKIFNANQFFKADVFSHQYKPSNGEFISVITKRFGAKS